jgi:deoxyribodipyrimidine photo-lyase
MKTAIWWIRRDLRLSDNQALTSAMEQAEVVLPVFILDPRLIQSPKMGRKRIDFLLAGLRSLDMQLRQRGSFLIIRQGDPLTELGILSKKADARRIFAQADVSPYARSRDERVSRELDLKLAGGITVHPVKAVLKPDGLPYTIFTPYCRKWTSLPLPGKPLPAPERFTRVTGISSGEIPEPVQIDPTSSFIASEAEAQRRLNDFSEAHIQQYAEKRDRLDLDGTSSLSPYLRFGMISARQAAWTALEASRRAADETGKTGARTWLNELVWREFFAVILYHVPQVLHTPFRNSLPDTAWRDDEAGFNSWKEGCTGFPVVDAAMRQLNATGWMHNRARMITASFLVKDLLVDWRKGESYFMQQLIDADPASNNGGWQWIAGTGTDAMPYFRIFNPVLQGKKFDPRGSFVRRWLPELAQVPDEYIHTPWKMPITLQAQLRCRIGKEYPAPLLDHAYARQRALEAYKRY